jgi:hypothetical protein
LLDDSIRNSRVSRKRKKEKMRKNEKKGEKKEKTEKRKRKSKENEKKKTKEKIPKKTKNKVFLNTTYRNRNNNNAKNWKQTQYTNTKPYKLQSKKYHAKQTLKINIEYQQTIPLSHNLTDQKYKIPTLGNQKTTRITHTSPNIGKYPKQTTRGKIPPKKHIFHSKISLLMCGDIESNPGPKFTLLLNHPQLHQDKHKTYFYKNTTQIKIEYIHIFEPFKPYLNHTHIENTNPQLKQFCIDNQQYPHNHLFFAILITLAPTPTQCNQLISKNSTR